MEITEKDIKMWSNLGPRPTFGLAMVELSRELEDLAVLTADVSTSAGLERFKKTYPEKFYDVGIAEQNMIGIATGLANTGTTVFTATFAPFQTMRCFEQIRVNAGYMKTKMCFVGLGSGIYYSYLGNTHCCFEDIAILRAIPNMTVLSPADGLEIVKCVFAAARHDGPVYIRLTGGAGMPIIYKQDYEFEIGKAVTVKEGDDVAILATGTMVNQAMLASQELEKRNIDCKVINVHTVKPIDKNMIDRLDDIKLIVTIEEHNIIGGLGSAVAEAMALKRNKPPHLLLGIEDFYPHASEYTDALAQCNLSVEQVVQNIIKNLG